MRPLDGRPPAGEDGVSRNDAGESSHRAEGSGASAPVPPSAPRPPEYHRRVETDGFIRWYEGDTLVREVRAADHYAAMQQEIVEYTPLSLPFDEGSEHAEHHRALTSDVEDGFRWPPGVTFSFITPTPPWAGTTVDPEGEVREAARDFRVPRQRNAVEAAWDAIRGSHLIPPPDGCPRCGAAPGVPCLRLTDDHPKPGEVHVHHERRSRA